MEHVPDSHPRARSLRDRHVIIQGMHDKVVTISGLFAHGRGEAFDYLMGEKTLPAARGAMEAAVAMLLLATRPVLSINGNVAALVPRETVALAKATGAALEVNLFYREPGREEAIEAVLREAGADTILGLGDVEPAFLGHLDSDRRIVDPRGIAVADVVMVPLEDGDRTLALRRAGKRVIAIDLNPLSRTSQAAHVTICDNITRAVPVMIDIAGRLADMPREALEAIVDRHDNAAILSRVIREIVEYLLEVGKKGVFIPVE